MAALAQPGDTWGISGPTFLTGYLLVALLILGGTLIHRRVLFAGRRPAKPTDLHPLQVAYLNGGGRLAVYTALGGLRCAGAVGTGPKGKLILAGPLPEQATPLDRAIHQAVSRNPKLRVLFHDPGVVAALAALHAELERVGLAVSRSARSAARVGPLLLLGLVALGVARLIAGISGGKPVGYLVLCLIGLLPATLLLLARVPRHTRAARWLLRQLRRTHRHLAPIERPAYPTYGPLATAMGVAIFGPATLWVLDPVFATEARVDRAMPMLGGGSAVPPNGGGVSCSGGDCGGGIGIGDGGCGGGGCGGGGCGG